uniref:Translationally-controlled tumor protein n=1 Tax=Gorilla gorilla gorilla TaxID=9595 RepID=A0A2I2Y221_GORGO
MNLAFFFSPLAPLSTLAPLRLHRACCELQAPAKLVLHRLPSAAILIIYRDLISHDEMFSDIYKIWEIMDGLYLEVEGKMVSRIEGNIDDSLIGGEGIESTVITGVDIVMNHHLQETSFTKEAYKKYIKDYMKSIKAKLEEQRPETVKPFMTEAAKQIKDILANFKNYQFFNCENMNPDGMVALLDYREDGVTPYMIFFKDDLEMENEGSFCNYSGWGLRLN